MSLKKKTVHSIFWSAIQQFGRQGFSFVFSILLARLLLPEQFGYIAMIMVFINISVTLIDSGLTQSLIREDQENQSDYSTIFYFNLGMSILLYAILYFGAPYVAGFYDQPILHNLIRWQGILIIIHAFSLVQETQMIKQLDFKTQFFASLPSIMIAGCIAIYMAYTGFGLYALVAYYVLDAAIRSIFLWFLSDWKPQFEFNLEKLKHHFKFGLHLSLAGLLETAFNEIYTIILGKYFSPTHLGHFNRAYTMQRMPVSNISSILNKVTYPIFAKIKHNNTKLKEVYAKLLLMVVFTLTPILLFLGILGEPLFRLLLTEKWVPAVPYFKILCIAGIVYPLSSYNINLLKIKGQSEAILKIQILKKVVFACSILFIFLWSMQGLLFGILFNSIIAFLINSYYSGKLIQFNTWQQISLILPILFLNLIAAGILYFISNSIIFLPDSLQLVIGLSIGFSIYLMLIAIFEKRIFSIMKEIIRSR